MAVARVEGALVAYLPGLAMRRIADLHAGEAKTDARDDAIIAEAARSMPRTLRSLRLADEQLAELTMLCGFDDDLAAPATAFAACLPRSIRRPSAFSDRASTIRWCSICLSATRRQPRLPQPARRRSPTA